MNQKIKSKLHTVALDELKAEIDETLKRIEEEEKKQKDNNENPEQHD